LEKPKSFNDTKNKQVFFTYESVKEVEMRGRDISFSVVKNQNENICSPIQYLVQMSYSDRISQLWTCTLNLKERNIQMRSRVKDDIQLLRVEQDE
jgi:hypothetical protein